MSSDLKTLVCTDIDPGWDDKYFESLFSSGAGVAGARVVGGGGEGAYGFVEFNTQEEAMNILSGYNNHPIQGTTRHYRLNWASANLSAPADYSNCVEASLYVTGLAPDVADGTLFQFFQQYYPSTKLANVQAGVGTVTFRDQAEQRRAVTEMHGQVLNGTPIAVSAQRPAAQPQQQSYAGGYGAAGGYAPAAVPTVGTPATVFVGNLDPSLTQAELQQAFASFQGITAVRIPEQGSRCGFVDTSSQEAAGQIIQYMNGQTVGNTQIRCEWGKSRTQNLQNAAPAADQYQQYAMQQQQAAQWQAYYAQQQQQQQQENEFCRPLDVEAMNSSYVESHKQLWNIVHSRSLWSC